MASPQVAGMVALAAQYLEEHDLAEKTGFSPRQLAQSLLMSTAEPMNRTKDTYWSILQQGAGLANIGALVNAESFVMMDSDAGESAADGKVKVELGDDPDRTGSYSFGFTLHNLTDVDRYYTLSADLFTQALNGEYLDLATEALAANVTWKVDGVPLKPGRQAGRMRLQRRRPVGCQRRAGPPGVCHRPSGVHLRPGPGRPERRRQGDHL